MKVTVQINGKPREVEEGIRLPEFLAQHGIDSRFIVIEYNGEIVFRPNYSEVRLKAGDVLEIVRMVGGG